MHDILSVYKGTYDAWGNIVSKSGSMADINPFRYRGYYYDTETGFYYLQTRYYDPSIRQFINADNYELLPILSQTIGQLNLYAYANNNPIMLTDETGESVTIALIVLAVGAIAGGTYMGIRSYNEGNRGWDVVLDVAIGVGVGLAISGAALFLGGMTTGFFTMFNMGVKVAAIGFAGFNFGLFVGTTLRGFNSPEPISLPQPYQPIILPPTITGF